RIVNVIRSQERFPAQESHNMTSKSPRHSLRTFAGMLISASLLGSLSFAQTAAPQPVKPDDTAANATADRATAYYHYALAHSYEEMATTYGRPEYATRAIEEYKLALNADPKSKYLNNGLAELYLRTGRVREAVLAAQEILKTEPHNLEGHHLL